MDGYATHLEAIVTAALESTGNILELGCGDYSTPVLSTIARHRFDNLLVKSSSPEWANRYRHLADIEIVNWDTWSISGNYGMIFIDSEEHHEGRMTKLLQIKDHARIIVMHDADQAMTDSRWPEIIKSFKSFKMFNTYQPWTVLLQC